MSAESKVEQVARVEQMAADKGETWDLSDNDQAALLAVLRDRVALLGALKLMITRFIACLVTNGTDAEFAQAAVTDADAIVARAEGLQ